MIPLKLELRNFMSYGDEPQTLDMSGMHTLCLAGENGNGKSALLDALTWTLWGESRAGKNRHDDLVRLGADEMSVTLTFEMDSQLYRVLRKRSKRASGNQWELQQDDGAGGWRSLTGNKSGDTGQEIQKLLRMSYDTFLNSAYLKQGQADQFVRQTPGKRKEILADILDLSRYDALEAKARERAKSAAADATDLERDLSGIAAELAQEAEHQDAIAQLQTSLVELQTRQETLKAEWDNIVGRLKDAEGQKKVADALQSQIALYVSELADHAADRDALISEIEAARALLSQRESITQDYEALLAVRVRLEQLEQDVTQWNRGQQALASAQREWDAAEHGLRTQVQLAAAQHHEAVQSVRELPDLRKERDTYAAKVAAYDALLQDEAAHEQALADAQEQLSRLKQDDARLGEQLRVWEERLAALARQQGTCQVCNAPLAKERADAVRLEYQAMADDITLQRKDGRAEGMKAKADLASIQARLQAMKATRDEAKSAHVRLGQIENELLRMDARAVDVPKLAAHLAEVTAMLESGTFAPELKSRLDKIGRGLTKYAHAEILYAQAKAEAATLLPSEQAHMGLAHAAKSLASAEARLARTETFMRQREQARADAETQMAAMTDVSHTLELLEARRTEIGTLERERQREHSRVEQSIGSHQEALKRCVAQRIMHKEKSAALAVARRSQEQYEQLTRAFGKKGVQAHIIENALPELQDEANALLDRLTDGDMSLYIDTLRESRTKRDSPIETLDIKVSDSLGTRPLEMYSGGEGFRAAFALRLALSKLLARRAGARLQTLIIDEGFGTQDGKGREKLVDALNAIGTDFEKIIVITHIDELKDSFPSRVEVIKTPSGSQITIMEGASG